MTAANFAIFRIDKYGYAHFLNNQFRTRERCKADARANGSRYAKALSPDDSRAIVVADLAWFKRNQDPDAKSEKELRRLHGQPEPESAGSIVITGAIPGLTRAQVKAALSARGYQVASAISGATALLLTGDKPGAEKIRAAKERGIPVMRWSDFA